MAGAHQLFVAVVVVSALMPMTFSALPPARWSPIEGPRISKQEGEYCFSYDPESVVAPHLWYRVCGSFHTFYGANQSPIMIDPSCVLKYCSAESKLRYSSSDDVSGTLENDGYYAKFTDLSEERNLFGVPGYENTPFKLGSVHVHIGKRDDAWQRTEHGVNGEKYDAEIHMVHSRGAGSGQVAGLAVISVFLSLSEGEENEEVNRLLDKVEEIQEYEGEVCRDFFTYCEGNDDGIRRNKRIHQIYQYDICNSRYTDEMDYLSYLENIYGRGISARLGRVAETFDNAFCIREDEQCPHHGTGTHDCGGVDLEISPERLLPTPRTYYYYYGSLTTATLSESVLWQVMMNPIKITKEQLESLEGMESRKPDTLISDFGNVRPRQSLNGRKVYANVCG